MGKKTTTRIICGEFMIQILIKVLARGPVRPGLPLWSRARHPASAADTYPNHQVHLADRICPRRPVDIVARIMAQVAVLLLGQQFVVENRAGSVAAISRPQPESTRCRTAIRCCSSGRQQRDQRFALQETVVRLRPRHRCRWRTSWKCTNMLVVLNAMPMKTVSGVHRLLQGQSGQDLLCLHPATAPRCTCRPNFLQGDDQMRHGACALSRIGDRLPRHHLQQGAAHLRQSAVGAGTGPWRHRARARCDLAAALAGRARHSGHRRDRLPDSRSVGFYGISAPKGTPPGKIVELLNKAVNEALRRPEAGGAALPSSAASRSRSTPAEFGKLVTDETEKWSKVVAFAGVSVDSTWKEPSRRSCSIAPPRSAL